MAGAGGFSLSLKGKKGPQRVAVQLKDKQESVDYVTGMSGKQLASLEPKATQGPLVIPKIENTFQVGVGKSTKSLKAREQRFLPTAQDSIDTSTDEKFEKAEDAVADIGIAYGLTKRGPAAGKAAGKGEGDGTALSQMMMSQQDKEAQQMKEDLEKLPDQSSLEAYESMPIEKFGEAMLRGMGWKEGMNVGRNQKSEVKAVEYVSRPGRLGLGAQPSAPSAKPPKKYIKPGESREGKKDLVLARDADGRQRNVRTLDEKLVKRELAGVHEGKVMWLAAGEHKGFLCTVLAVSHGTGEATVRLKPSDETVTARCDDLAERWERNESSGDKDSRGKHKEKSRDRDSDRGRHREDKGRDRDRDRGREKDRERRHEQRREDERPSKKTRRSPSPLRPSARSWLAANIRVRIVDKRLGRGKFYLKKAVVTDVTSPGICEVRVDETNEAIQEVSQKQLETYVPKGDGIRVLILQGDLKGQKARLLQRNSSTSMAAVQMTADFSVEKLPLDDIAQYVGPMGEDE